MAEGVEVFVICSVASIEPGSAKAFSLSRVTETGEAKPFPIVIIRPSADSYFGYVNVCPHERRWLNIGSGGFFTEDGAYLRCGRHNAHFEIETGLCVDGPCKGQGLEPIALAAIDGDVCLCGVKLVEEERVPDPFDDDDETMEIMIQPD